jgi:hypothetical protein
MNINTLPIVVSAIGLKTTLDIVSTGFSTLKTSTSALIACRHPHKDIASFLAKSDLLFKFTIMKSFVDEIDYQNTLYVKTVTSLVQGISVILDKINDIFTEITKISEYNKKIYFSYFKMNVDVQVSSLEELGYLLESRFHLLCNILQS